MTRYASQTTVSSHKSRDEIERTLRRYGAEEFVYGWQEMQAEDRAEVEEQRDSRLAELFEREQVVED